MKPSFSVIRSPTLWVIIPISIAFVISYPLVYLLLNGTNPIVPSDWVPSSGAQPQVTIKQAIVYPPPRDSGLSVDQSLIDSLRSLYEDLGVSPNNHFLLCKDETLASQGGNNKPGFLKPSASFNLNDLPYFHCLTNLSEVEFLDFPTISTLLSRTGRRRHGRFSPQGLLLTYVESFETPNLEGNKKQNSANIAARFDHQSLDYSLDFLTNELGRATLSLRDSTELDFMSGTLQHSQQSQQSGLLHESYQSHQPLESHLSHQSQQQSQKQNLQKTIHKDHENQNLDDTWSNDDIDSNESLFSSKKNDASDNSDRFEFLADDKNMKEHMVESNLEEQIDLHQSSTERKSLWQKGVKKLLHTTPPNPPLVDLVHNTNGHPFALLPGCPRFVTVLFVITAIFCFYCFIVIMDFSSIYSRLSIAIGFTLQTILSLTSAISVVSMIYSGLPLYRLKQYIALPLVVVFLSGSLTFKLLTSVGSKASMVIPGLAILSVDLFPRAARHTVITSMVLGLAFLPMLELSPFAKAICLIGILASVFSLLLNITFFTALLALDLRVKEEARLNLSSDLFDNQNTLSWDWHLKAYLYTRYYFIKRITPPFMALAIVGYFYLGTHNILGDYINENVLIPLDKTSLFINPLLDNMNITSIRVYSPLILRSKPDYNSFTWEYSSLTSLPIATYFNFSEISIMRVLLRIIATLILIASVTTAILKVIYGSFEDSYWDVGTIFKDHFHCKDLLGYHLLDIIQITASGSHIVTVSTDRRAYVWNVARSGDGIIRPLFLIPLTADMWPVTRILLDTASNRVCVFSKRSPLIFVWNYGNGVLEFKFHDDHLYDGGCIEAFFSKFDLTVVTSENYIISLNKLGKPTIFNVEPFQSKNVKIVSCKRILTPRLPERIVLLSSNSDLVIGTRLGKAWRFSSLSLKPSKSIADWQIRSAFITSIVPVTALNMILLSTDLTTCLIDLHTGTVLRVFQIGHFKRGSLKVFHTEVVHCIFCGSASVDTLSIAYNDAENPDMVICHTLSIENRGRRSICCRAERDYRETRCLGFDQVTEQQHWIGNVEGWDVIDMNMILGVRRKENDGYSEEKNIDSSITSLRQRRVKQPMAKPVSQAHLIGDTWEGWGMSANGQVSYYNIPDSTELKEYGKSRKGSVDAFNMLLINKAGPVTTFGYKSIAVVFGNIVKVLYFGNEEKYVEKSSGRRDSTRRWKRSSRGIL